MQANWKSQSLLPITPPPIYIVGTDTEVGKTYQATRLVEALARAGKTVGVYKPVLSGIEAIEDQAGETNCNASGSDDASLLLRASRHSWPRERVCPQSYQAPVAPPIAARMEGKSVDDGLLAEGLSWWSGRCDVLVVEGAGGVLSPLSDSSTILDLAAMSKGRVIVVAANRLGVVNHTLLTLSAVRARGIEILGVVLNEIPRSDEQEQNGSEPGDMRDPSQPTNMELLREWEAEVPISLDIESLVSSI